MEIKVTDSTLQVKKIQSCLLIIIKEIKRVCEKNDIPYFMLAGTLLGAVRHNGFIPWDDDMDIGMLRADYNRFVEACEKDLDHEKFFLQRMETDPGFGKFYIRILLNGTYLDYKYIKNTNTKKALFVDVFPYDSIPNSKILQKKQSVITSFALRLLKKKLKYGIECFTLGGKLELLLTPFFSKKTLIRMYNKEMQRYNENQDTKYINCANAGYGYFKEILQRKWITDTREFQFEDLSLPGTVHYDEYLTHLYGDYMTIPSRENQITHEFEHLDFGPYKDLI